VRVAVDASTQTSYTLIVQHDIMAASTTSMSEVVTSEHVASMAVQHGSG